MKARPLHPAGRDRPWPHEVVAAGGDHVTANDLREGDGRIAGIPGNQPANQCLSIRGRSGCRQQLGSEGHRIDGLPRRPRLRPLILSSHTMLAWSAPRELQRTPVSSRDARNKYHFSSSAFGTETIGRLTETEATMLKVP